MDRRSLLSTFFAPAKASGQSRSSMAINNNITAYTGPWGYEQAAHLLRRGMFGPTREQIKWSIEQGMEATLDKLFEDLPMPEPPVNSYYQSDPNVPIGATWVQAPYTNVHLSQALGYRGRSLLSWTIGQMWQEGISCREKLTLFWHNHFPVAEINDPKYQYRYITLLRSHAWGDFRELTKAITIDPAMLRYLNGNQSSAVSPNENYARELLELFTIGKGPAAGPDDYTNYTEVDVREIARALTGWRDHGYTTQSADGSIRSDFIPARHDAGTKNLSHRFDHAVIENMGDQEYAYVIDIIFQKVEVARFICRKLYRWFVYYEITEEAEANVIEPMAQLLFDGDFHIKPALRLLLASEHFYDPENTGAMIKNPFDFAMSILKPLEVTASTEPIDKKYDAWYHYHGMTRHMQMEYFNVPDVAGWRAYYLAPLYYRHWISATTLPQRMRASNRLATSGYLPFQANGALMRADVLKVVAELDSPLDPNAVVEELAMLLFPKPLKDGQKAALKEVLLPGLPDFEWTLEYGEYLQNPANSSLASSIEAKLRALLNAMLSMPEFQLS